jgi:hypothetical protein
VAVGEVIHRSQSSRRVFQRAERIATGDEGAHGSLQPKHLLQALLEFPDAPWEGLLVEMGIGDALELIVDRAPGQEGAPGRTVFADDEGQSAGAEPSQGRRIPLL